MLGMGRAARVEEVDADLINAGKISVTEAPGAAYFHHADSFAMMRGGHIDYCVMGAYQVSADGDLANWSTNSSTSIPGVGGAMDLAVGARHVYVVMDLLTKAGESKLVEKCDYPLTGSRCVERLYTDTAAFEITETGVRVIEIFDDLTISELSALVGLPLR
jgi:3-oxoadipate CoA-transferase beta subunit